MFDYKLIEAFAMVVQEGGFERAARLLCLTQSAVSQRVRQLEDRCGQVLLSRTAPPRVTAAGRQLLKHYRQVKLLEEGLAGGAAEEEPQATTLAIGLNADSLATWFLQAVAPLLESGQQLLDLRIDDQEQTHRMLKDGEVVGCISTEATAMQGCRLEFLGTMAYRLLATPHFRKRWFPAGLSLQAAATAPALIFNRKDRLHHQCFEQALGSSPASFPAHFVPSSEQFIDFIAAGYAYGMLPDCHSEKLRRSGQLVELDPGQPVAVELYWHCWNLDSAPLRQLTEQLVGAASRLLVREN